MDTEGFSVITQRRHQGSLDRPSVLEARPQSGWAESNTISPIGNTQCLTFECDPACRRSVLALILGGCPSAVVRTIWQIVVFSVKRHADWPDTHISHKRFEASAPTIADDYASASPMLEADGARIVAAGDHVLPTGISFSATKPVREPRLDDEASAAFSGALEKRRRPDDHIGAAVTATVPDYMFSGSTLSVERKCGQPAKMAISQVDHVPTHLVGLLLKVSAWMVGSKRFLTLTFRALSAAMRFVSVSGGEQRAAVWASAYHKRKHTELKQGICETTFDTNDDRGMVSVSHNVILPLSRYSAVPV